MLWVEENVIYYFFNSRLRIRRYRLYVVRLLWYNYNGEGDSLIYKAARLLGIKWYAEVFFIFRRFGVYNSSSSWYNIGMIIMGESKLFHRGPGNKIKRPPTTCRQLKSEIRSFSFFSSLYIGEKEVFWYFGRNQIVFVFK